jgi:hypothetical protein
MFGCINWISKIYHHAWEKKPSNHEERVVYRLDLLEVKVDLNPIGGFRGKIGTLTIGHVKHLVFTEWSERDLQNLAKLTQLILKIQEEAHVNNTLIFARQDLFNENFKLSLIPYPKCNWIEKIQGLVHVIFGTSSLNEKQVEEIAQFYQGQFSQKFEIIESKGEERKGAPDPFCKKTVVEKQKIVDLTIDNQRFYLLHDHRPKGAEKNDPHFLIVPQGDQGHCDGSKVPISLRLSMLKCVQAAMRIYKNEKLYKTLLYLERNGEQLQGVNHKHSHVQAIREFPESLYAKFRVIMRQFFSPTLSQHNLESRIRHYQRYEWSLI